MMTVRPKEDTEDSEFERDAEGYRDHLAFGLRINLY